MTEDFSGDIFDSLCNVEQNTYTEGHQQGVKIGQRIGILEGRDLGLEKGMLIGEELGYYVQVSAWISSQHSTNERICRSAQKLMELVEHGTWTNPRDERLLENLQRIRAKFKALIASAKLDPIKFSFNPEAVRAEQQMSF